MSHNPSSPYPDKKMQNEMRRAVKSEPLPDDKQGAAWYAVKDSESYSSVRYRAVLHEAHGEQEVWIARELAHHIAQQIADDHNRARRPGGDWYRRKIEQTGEEPHAIGPAPITQCPDGQKCSSTTTGQCWGQCARASVGQIKDATSHSATRLSSRRP